ncbi:MAG: motility associated factor glycosyltransferase family protein [Hahellaceae bacterium]|nr:motility associated factor glycosyltransferase family protein [Hahellaceae bacterium]MCP5211717.1 motility associated factor glycosyltransferase family protein [Hahellaceae bacterium]
MTQKHSHPAEKYLSLRAKNLAFFQRRYPGIFDFFSNYAMRSAKVDLIPEDDEVDLLEGTERLYGGQGKAYAKREVATFLSHIDIGSRIRSIQPLSADGYKNQRLFARSIREVYQKSPITPEQFNGYLLDGFFPMVVFMGVGLGHHINILNQIRDIQHIIIVERDMDKFAASLYCVNWQQIVGDRLDVEGKSISFVLLPNISDVNLIQISVWNQLIKFTPHFPVSTVFYNHRADRIFDEVSDRINRDLYTHLYSFGNWDDELNQLNNFLHNCRQGIKKIPQPANITQLAQQVPVCIVGSGPSLDARIEDLKRLAPGSIVISCGTALRALYAHGVRPDIHVELESDYATYLTQSMMDDRAFMHSIPLIGAAQLNPLTFSLFGEKRMFFKADGMLAGIFGEHGDAVAGATPTCTNAAIAITHHYGFKELYLFGLDYGFPNKQQHHAKGTLYYKVDYAEGIDEERVYPDNDLLTIPSAAGGTIKTTSFLYSGKRRTEDLLALVACYGQVFNCSNGAVLENTRWLDRSGVISRLSVKRRKDQWAAKSSFIKALFENDNPKLADINLAEGGDQLHGVLKAFVQELISELEQEIPDNRALSFLCARFSAKLESLCVNNDALYFFFRGTVWHFLLAGFCLALAAVDKKREHIFIRKWKSQFADFLRVTCIELLQVIENPYDLETDPLIRKSIVEPDRDFRPAIFDGDLASCDWYFEELMIDEFGVITPYTW